MEPLLNENFRKHFPTLLVLSEMGAINKTIKTSTKALAKRIGVSQQTISRELIDIEKTGWISRTVIREGSLIRITELGSSQIKQLYSVLRAILENKYRLSVTIEGKVFSGLGEGSYYVTRKPYRKQFVEKLGFNPYPGTLNLRLISSYDLSIWSELERLPGIEIKGFKNKDRTYGQVRCFHAKIGNKEKGAVVIALRTHYDRKVLEIIAPNYLRKRLKLKDGHKVRVEIFLNPD